MNRLYEALKADIALVSQALNNSNATGRYYSMAGFMRAIAILNGGAMAATKVTTVELLQAQDAAGTGSKGIPSTAGQAATATVTANSLVTEGTLTLGTVLAADAVTINGLTFTAHATVTTVASRQFSISGNDTADAVELAACINDSTYGVPGITATPSAAVITLAPTVPGAATVTVANPASTITAATTKAQAYVEIENFSLDHANGFTHVAVKITTTANSNLAAVLLRGYPRDAVSQQVGASAVV